MAGGRKRILQAFYVPAQYSYQYRILKNCLFYLFDYIRQILVTELELCKFKDRNILSVSLRKYLECLLSASSLLKVPVKPSIFPTNLKAGDFFFLFTAEIPVK